MDCLEFGWLFDSIDLMGVRTLSLPLSRFAIAQRRQLSLSNNIRESVFSPVYAI